MLLIASDTAFSNYIYHLDTLFMLSQYILDKTIFCSIYNGYYSTLSSSILNTYPYFDDREDFLYLLLDQIAEEVDINGICYGHCPCSNSLYKWENTFCRKACRLDRRYEAGKISEAVYCEKMNNLVSEFNDKNGREIRPNFVCD